MRQIRQPKMVVTTAPRRPVLMKLWKPEDVSKLVRPEAMSTCPLLMLKMRAATNMHVHTRSCLRAKVGQNMDVRARAEQARSKRGIPADEELAEVLAGEEQGTVSVRDLVVYVLGLGHLQDGKGRDLRGSEC